MNQNKLPRLPPHKFNYHDSGRYQMISEFMVFNSATLQGINGWTAIGWAPNHKLSYQREPIDEDMEWIGVRFEKENGEAVWFHVVIYYDFLQEGD